MVCVVPSDSRLRGPRLAAVAAAAALFALSVGTFALRIPFDRAPDEWTHDYYNVRFLLAEGRLPVPGLDDRSAFETASRNPSRRIVARYSYTTAPALNYVLYAGAGWLGPRTLGIDRISSERALSALWGLVFFAGIYGAARAIDARASTALAAAGAAAFVPQVQFVASYISQDAFALAASSAAVWAVAHDRRVSTVRSFALAGAMTGWVLTARLNYWILLPWLGIWALWRIGRAPAALRIRARLGVAWGAAALAVCGFWLGRVVAETGSLTGLDWALAEMRRVQGVTIEPTLDAAALRALLERDFVGKTFRSTFMTFDYMSLEFSQPGIYSALAVLVLALAAAAGAVIIVHRDHLAARVAAGLAVTTLGLGALHVYNSIFWDFQPQGRYFFPLLAPLAVFLAWLAGRHPVLQPGLLGFVAAMLALTVYTHLLVSRSYGGVDPQAAAAVRRLPLGTARRLVHERWIKVPADAWRGVALEREDAVLPYDVAFYGLEVLDTDSDRPLRTAYLPPLFWRLHVKPEFRFRPVPNSAGRIYRLRFFAEQQGVAGAAMRTGCAEASGSPPEGRSTEPRLCVRLLF
jgi:hypothetical protein